jgi:hypothetical protein
MPQGLPKRISGREKGGLALPPVAPLVMPITPFGGFFPEREPLSRTGCSQGTSP